MKQFEIFRSHTRNFIKKKQLFPFFFSLWRAQIQLKDLLSQEKTQQREGRFVRIRREDADVPMAQWEAEGLLSAGMVLFQGNTANPCHKTQPTSSAFQLTDTASWPALQDLVLMTLSTSQLAWTDKLDLGSGARHGALLLCRWPDIAIFPHLKTNGLAANLYYSQNISI